MKKYHRLKKKTNLKFKRAEERKSRRVEGRKKKLQFKIK
jgi:hypothetical protein